MAIHHLNIAIISRGDGSSVTAAAAYRAGQRIVDARTGEVHDYRRRCGVSCTEILTPPGAAPWTRDRAALWNLVERAERRRDAQLAREVILALPRELSPAMNRSLAREYFRRHFVSRGMLVDLALHDLDGLNPHAHGLVSLRELAGDGFAARKNRDWNDRELVREWREGATTLINEYLARAGVAPENRIDHRTLDVQRAEALAGGEYERALALCRLPTKHLGKVATAVLARGGISTRANYLQEEAEARAADVVEMRREVELEQKRSDRVAALRAQPTGFGLFERKLAELAPGCRDVDEADTAFVDEALKHAEAELGRIESEDRAADARRLAEERRRRKVRLESIKQAPEGQRLYTERLDELAPGWRETQNAPAARIDEALTYAEAEVQRRAAARRRDEEARRRAEEDRRRREAERARAGRVAAIEKTSEGWQLYTERLDELAPGWRETQNAPAARIDEALTYAEAEVQRRADARRRDEEARRRAEEDRRRREAERARAGRVAAIEKTTEGWKLYTEKLAALAPGWRETQKAPAARIDEALTYAEAELERRAAARRREEEARRAEEDRRRKEAERALARRIESIRETTEGWKLYTEKLAALAPGWRETQKAPAARIDEALTYAEAELERRAAARRREEEARRRAEEDRRRKEAEWALARRIELIKETSEGWKLYTEKLAALAPGWRETQKAPAARIDEALTYAEAELKRRTRAEEERERKAAKRRADRIDRLFKEPGGDERFLSAIASRNPHWRKDGTGPAGIDHALEVADRRRGRAESTLQQHELVLDGERTFANAGSIEWEKACDAFDGETDADERACAVTRLLSDRARVREIVAGSSGAQTSPSLVKRLVTWLRRQVARLLHVFHLVRHAADEVEAGVSKTQPLPHSRPDYWVPAVEEALEPPPGADAFRKDVYGEVRDRYDRRVVAEDLDARFGRSDREASEERYLKPLVDGTYERQRRSWLRSSSSPPPTLESARAVVVDAHRSRVAEFFEIACCRATGRTEDAERLERRREQIGLAADEVEADVPKTRPLPHSRSDYQVPAVADQALEPPPGADGFTKAVYGEVRDRYDRRAVAEDVDARFESSDREASEQRYLKPLVDGTYERQRRSWSPSTSSPPPTLESARAVVVEVHRSRVAELFEIACYRATGRTEAAERLERRREQIEGAAEAVEAGVPTAQPDPHLRPGHWVPTVADEAVEPPSDADAFVTAVYAEVRDRYDRHAVAEDLASRFDGADREASEQRYLAPLVDGTLERQRRSWLRSRSSPPPTLESARAVVAEAHRSRVAELFEIACYRATGRTEAAERLERRREQIEGAAEAVEAGVPTAQPDPHLRPGHWVPTVADEAVEPPSDADAFVTAVYAEVRDRYDRRAVAEDVDARFESSDREASEQRYLKPLVDGTYERQRRSWSPSTSSPPPTLESARAVVAEAHRSRVAELFEIACYRATGRTEAAERLERRREQIEGAADAVEAGVPTAQPDPHLRPGHWVPTVADEAVEPPSDADAFVTAVYAEVRDRYDRHAVAEDLASRFDGADREASEQRYLAPLVDGTLERQRRSWLRSRSSPAPTLESARAVVAEAHRSRVAELFEIACYRATGRTEAAERLERRREQIEGAADAVEAGVPTAQPDPHLRPGHWVPTVADEAVEPPSDADAFVTAVYAEVRDRYDRRAVAEDVDARFESSDREASEQRYLKPLVDGTYERQRRSWSPSTSSPPPTLESARAVVAEAHRSRVAELFEIACYRATGRTEDAERLERRREQIGLAADEVEAGVSKARPLPHSRSDYQVPAVADEALEPPPGADGFTKAVYAEVRDRYDRRAVAEDVDARFDRSDREASEERHVDAIVAETLECQRHGRVAAERESPPKSRAAVRERILGEYRLDVQDIFLAACREGRRGGAPIECRPDRTSERPSVAESKPPRETVHAVSGTGVDVSAGNQEGGSRSPRSEPSECRPQREPTEQASPSSVPAQPAMAATAPASTGTSVDQIEERDDERDGSREAEGDSLRRVRSDQASPSSAPATRAMPAAAPKAQGAAANRGMEADEPDDPGRVHPAPVRSGAGSRSSPKPAKDKRGISFGR